MESWNPVVNFVRRVKGEYETQFGKVDYSHGEFQTTIEKWVDDLIEANKQCDLYYEWDEMLSYLIFTQYGDLILFRYSYSGEPNYWDAFNQFYRECRSVVINIRTDELVLCPFRKFFNVNELKETSLPILEEQLKQAKEIEISSKLDGSMQSARWYNGRIIMSGSKALDKDRSWRLDDGYRMIQAKPGYAELLKQYPEYTFIFEYISLRDAHIVKYSKGQEGLYLIGARNNETGKELSYKAVLELANKYDIPTVELFNKTVYQILAELDDKTSDEAEGFVIRVDDNRYKLKYNDYVKVHKILNKLMTPNAVIKNLADNTIDEFLSKLPTMQKERVMGLANVINTCEKEITDCVEMYYTQAPKKEKKEFMLWVTDNVPEEYQWYIREKFYGREVNVLKNRSGYKGFYEIVLMSNISHRSVMIKETPK